MDVALGLINQYLPHLSLLFACENPLSAVLYCHVMGIKNIYMFNYGNSLFEREMTFMCCSTFTCWQLNDRLSPSSLPVYLQQRESGGVCGQRAEHNLSDSLSAAQPDQDRRGRPDSVFQPGHALPFPRGRSQNILACVCISFRCTLWAFVLMCVCDFLCAWKECLNIHLTFLLLLLLPLLLLLLLVPRCLLSAAVFQLQRTADPAGLLRVPPHQQHREAGSDVVHPAHFPPAGGVASGGPVWQRRPAGQNPVSLLPGTHTHTHTRSLLLQFPSDSFSSCVTIPRFRLDMAYFLSTRFRL